MTKEVIDQVMRIFRSAKDKDEAAKALLKMIKVFEPELIKEIRHGDR